MKHIYVGMYVETATVHGTVKEILEGRDLDWDDTDYHVVVADHPIANCGEVHIVRLDQIRSAKWKKLTPSPETTSENS